MKVVIGSGNTKYDGWYHTQKNELDLLKREMFAKAFPEKHIEAFLAEHVWEHLSLDEGMIAAKNCFDFLAPGGYVRIAVPDINFHNDWYQNMVQVEVRDLKIILHSPIKLCMTIEVY